MQTILALDQGATSARAIRFDRARRVVSVAQQEFRQAFPRPRWVGHAANDIWRSLHTVAIAALKQVGLQARDENAIGITNQRETTVLGDRKTGKPVANAIIWRDRHAAGRCNELRARGRAAMIQNTTGLVLDANFSGTQLQWLLDHVPGTRARKGELTFGTVDRWLIWKLTGGRDHVTDASNASRTRLFNIDDLPWDEGLLSLFDIPASVLSHVVARCGKLGQTDAAIFGTALPIAGVAGDLQAIDDAPRLHGFGAEQAQVLAIPDASSELAPGLSEAIARFAVRCEYARCVEDVLARRAGLLFLDAALARRQAAETGDIVQQETG